MNDEAAIRPGRSVTDLAATGTWKITTGTKGQWITAERAIDAAGHRWVIGLTPTAGGATALMLWSDDAVVRHLRGGEAEMCQTAYRWAAELLAGRAPDTP